MYVWLGKQLGMSLNDVYQLKWNTNTVQYSIILYLDGIELKQYHRYMLPVYMVVYNS